ncbi:DHHW family protein [Paenibacillus radicis (ex Gao et al. 2016)]|uniref:AlgX/AlgJ SGNH hydrolase-like domain-containing protein n=1 Tax=Paenibacillus radicis (ex Gao et al. 2016) TaxID=1737354 RepID=A0A917LZY4_9BACL|nr:DHHW family protein [Paenibacillus radicis (ex Gao et al. 2016)]GGG68791.1 hypothetical protein GCM10010918_24740 [Paenibacillus radicis (ex Gao et al. 2016)]
MNKKLSIVYIIVFSTVIFGFGMASILSPDKGVSVSENRSLSHFPSISLAAFTTRTFFEDMNLYVNDQLVLRDDMVRLYQDQQNAKMFNAMLFENLLHTNKMQTPGDGTKIKDSRIVSKLVITNNKWILPSTDKVVHTDHIDTSTAKLNDAVAFAEEQGTETFFVFNPSRTKALMHLYPEYMQTDAYAQSKQYFLSKLDPTINVINIGDVFDTFSNAQLEELYLETDHHWNMKGAFTAYQEMITQISNKSAQFEGKPMSLNEIRTSQLTSGSFEGSYNSQVNFAVNAKKADRTIIYEPKTPFTFKHFEVFNKDGKQTVASFQDFYGFKPGRSTYSYGTIYGGDRQKIIYENDKANNSLNVLLLKDSFMNPLTPYFAQSFNHLTVLDNRYYSEFSLKKILTSRHYDMLIIAFHDDNLFSGTYDFEKTNGQ